MVQGASLTVDIENGLGLRYCYRYPRIASRFSSPLVNTRNLELSGCDAPASAVLALRVAARLKPLAFIDGEATYWIEALAAGAADAGMLSAFHATEPGRGRGRVAHAFARLRSPVRSPICSIWTPSRPTTGRT
jgi:hypothetical protein